MKSLPGLLVEYLVIGATALGALWILHISGVVAFGIWNTVAEMTPAQAIFLAPAIYCLGMFVDFLSILMTRFMSLISDPSWDFLNKKFTSVPERVSLDERYSQAELHARSDVLGAEYVMRSSRDRVARSFYVVVLSITISLGITGNDWDVIMVAALVTILSYLMYLRFHHLTRRWKRKATKALKKIAEE